MPIDDINVIVGNQPNELHRELTRGLMLKNNMMLSSEIVSDLHSIVEKLTQEDGITTTNILFISADLMEHLATYKDLSGRQKKQLIINILEKFIRDSDMENVYKDILCEVVENLVPGAIDIIIDVSKGRYFKKITKKLSCCCK